MKNEMNDSDFCTETNQQKQKAPKRRLKRKIRRAMSGSLALVCAFMGTHIVNGQIDPLVLSLGVYTNQEMVEQANERLLNRSSKQLTRIPVFAHRGFAQNALDNSYAAFDIALQSGCPQIELDVRSSADGVYYVSHDDNIKSITGLDWWISQKTSAELDGVLMSNGEKLHRLSEVVERYRDQMIYLVEIKDESGDAWPFLDVVKGHPQLAQNIQVQSFDRKVLEAIHHELPNMFVQWLINDHHKVEEALNCDWLDSIALDHILISEDRVRTIHEHQKEVWLWTVDDLEMIHTYLSWGVDGVITNLESAVSLYKEMAFE